MVDSPDFEVREAREEEYTGAAVALANAFAYDPVMSQAMGGAGQEEKIRRLFDFQIRKTYAPRGVVDVVVDAQGQVLGAALWISPQGQKGSLVQDLMSLPSYFRVLGKSLLPGAFTDLRLIAARPKFDHWYLYCIGVHEQARGRGVGAALLDFRRQQLGEYPAYLEASTFRSASLYARHGFVELFRFKGGKPAVGMLHPAPVTQVSLQDHHTSK